MGVLRASWFGGLARQTPFYRMHLLCAGLHEQADGYGVPCAGDAGGKGRRGEGGKGREESREKREE